MNSEKINFNYPIHQTCLKLFRALVFFDAKTVKGRCLGTSLTMDMIKRVSRDFPFDNFWQRFGMKTLKSKTIARVDH